jgi:hypothetical protein
MTNNTKTAQLWMGFHHLSEQQKALSITITEQIAKSLQASRSVDTESTQEKNRRYVGIDRPLGGTIK